MTTPVRTDKAPRKPPFKDRRAPAGTDKPAGSLRWLKSLLGRPLGLVRRGGDWHLELLDRRRAATVDASSWTQLRAELRERLRDPRHRQAQSTLRHLVATVNELKRKGWSGVEALPDAVIEKAHVQADMLLAGAPLPALAHLVERLGVLQADRARHRASAQPAPAVEVSEVTHEEFEAMERSWAGTIPPELVPTSGPP